MRSEMSKEDNELSMLFKHPIPGGYWYCEFKMAYKLIPVLIGHQAQSSFETGHVDLVYDDRIVPTQPFSAQFGFEYPAPHLFPALDIDVSALSIDQDFAGAKVLGSTGTAAEISFNNLCNPTETVRLEYTAAFATGTSEAIDLFNLRHPNYFLPVINSFEPTQTIPAYPDLPDYALIICVEPTDAAPAYPEMPDYALIACVEPTDAASVYPEIPDYSLIICAEPSGEMYSFGGASDQILVLPDHMVSSDIFAHEWPFFM